jgi:hypothetical protein
VTAVFALFFFHGSPPLFNAERMWSLEFSETEAEQRDLVVLMVCGGAYVLALVMYTLMFDASLIGYFDGAVSA